MSFFDGRIGGTVEGTGGGSTSTQSATVNFLPSTSQSAPPVVSVYPAGQGLSTINQALPSSAAYSSPPASSAPRLAPNATTYAYLAVIVALGAGAWLLLRKVR